jgi:hypothetical protein
VTNLIKQEFVLIEIINFSLNYIIFTSLLFVARLRHLKAQVLDTNYCYRKILRLTVRRATLAQYMGLAV